MPRCDTGLCLAQFVPVDQNPHAPSKDAATLRIVVGLPVHEAVDVGPRHGISVEGDVAPLDDGFDDRRRHGLNDAFRVLVPRLVLLDDGLGLGVWDQFKDALIREVEGLHLDLLRWQHPNAGPSLVVLLEPRHGAVIGIPTDLPLLNGLAILLEGTNLLLADVTRHLLVGVLAPDVHHPDEVALMGDAEEPVEQVDTLCPPLTEAGRLDCDLSVSGLRHADADLTDRQLGVEINSLTDERLGAVEEPVVVPLLMQ